MIEIKQLHLHTRDKPLISDLQCRLSLGEIWCVIGRNGVGKSTLLRTLAGIQTPNKGDILLNNQPLSEWSLKALAMQRALLGQDNIDAFGFTVLEQVLAARHPHGSRVWESPHDQEIAMHAMNEMGVADLAHRLVNTLSGGERQRVSLAAIWAQETPLVFLDEPMSALDLGHQVALMKQLKKKQQSAQKLIVMVSHDLNHALDVATHALLLMGNGEWFAGTREEAMTAPLLSQCLGYPLEIMEKDGRKVFLPSRQEQGDASN